MFEETVFVYAPFLKGFVMRLIVLLMTVAVSGCAASDYSGAISDMSTAVEQSVSAIEVLDAQLTEVRNEQLEREILNNTLLLEASKGECLPKGNACGLSVQKPGDKAGSYPIVSVLPNAIKPLEALKQYVSDLEAIVAADTVASVAASTNKTLGNLVALQDALPNQSRSSLADYSAPVGQAVNWVFGQYIEYIKVSALSDAIIQADPIIQELDAFYAAELEAMRAIWVARAAKKFSPIRINFEGLRRGTITLQDVEQYRKAAAEYEIALSATYTNPIASFAKAHAALSAHFDGDEDTLTIALAAIDRLKAEAKTLKTIVEAFEKVAD